MINNPVLRGFNPDPSFLRVGDDYYLATSTFEWFPGVRLHHSKDLVHWRLIGHALRDLTRLDLRGVADSAGVWAPSLSWDAGRFYLVYTNVRTCGYQRPFKDTPFYLITAENIDGPWTEPIHLGSAGFDPSLFHDEDGRKWLVNMAWDFRKGHSRFDGITLQEYDPGAQRLIGPAYNILRKHELIEGPNLYKRSGVYYLMLAEGGTGWNHGISMARARSLLGPYEVDPVGSVLTSRNDESLELQKAGHGELVQTPAGDWYLAHLCSRPLGKGENRRCILGRETALQRVVWSQDGWLRLPDGTTRPAIEVMTPAELPEKSWPPLAERDDFDCLTLGPHWNSLRVPVSDSWLTFRERPGWLRLRGRESLFSLFDQSLIAQRLQSFHIVAETCLEFKPETFNQMAGLICWYDTRTHYYLRVTHHDVLGTILGIILTDDGVYDEMSDSQVAINGWDRCHLRAEINYGKLQFSASRDGSEWQLVGAQLDATKLSDDYGRNILHFTGAFIGICAQDMGGRRLHADFDYFELRDLDQS